MKFIFMVMISHNIDILLLFTNFIYFVQNLFKIVLLFVHIPCRNYSLSHLTKILPIYSILIPLYKEVGNIKIINDGLSNLKYPQSCLDIIVLIEEDDRETLLELTSVNIEFYIKIVIIPNSFPKTKPKALNYGFNFIRGQFITIYDAEDKPDSDQLLKALQKFNQLPKEYVCLQARLNFYNKNENILTKFFSMEYFHWFNCLLAGLEQFLLPINLGGTSNHFKSEIIKKIGLWDPYNVTEDADLGIRIYMHGYKTSLLDSYTLEESPIDLFSWIFQRIRWIKGILQTILVYLKTSFFVLNKMNVKSHLSIILFLIFGTYSFYILPIIILLGFLYTNEFFETLWQYNMFISIIYIYSAAFHSLVKTSKIISVLDIIAFIFFPSYFILHTISAYFALIQLIIKPFHWNKTKHGLTKF